MSRVFAACFAILLQLIGWSSLAGAAAEITSSEVYAQALTIQEETALIKERLGLTGDKPPQLIHAALQPRHVWQKSYLVQLKINLFRRQRGFPSLSTNHIEPMLTLTPMYVYEQTQRIQTEINLLKKWLGVTDSTQPHPVVAGKTPVDVFNLLHAISLQWDVINQQEVGPKEVYAEVKRIDEDINTILGFLHVQDVAYPPAKIVDHTPKDSLRAVFVLMGEVQRLQRLAKLPLVDFQPFYREKEVLSSDVLNMVVMVLAEMQTVKAHLGLTHELTSPAAQQGEKNPAHVTQLLGYLARKLQLIRSL